MANEVVRTEIVTALQRASESGMAANLLSGFEKAFAKADTIMTLKEHLTPTVMKVFKSLMGTATGFKTDKADYSDDVVKNCMIEAINIGVNITDNQFNIIAGRAYITKEGFRFLLKQIPGLKFTDKRKGLPVWDAEKVTVTMIIDWEYKGEKDSVELPFSFKIEKSQFGKVVTTDDNITGKATRKSLKWLYEKIYGLDVPDGDSESVDRSGLDKSNEIKNPLQQVDDAEVVKPTVDEILFNAGLTLEDVANYCTCGNYVLERVMIRLVENTGAAVAQIKKFKNEVQNG